jgi:hypothetical protein
MQRLGARPANVADAIAEVGLQALRRRESQPSKGNREKAPHAAGVAVVVGFGLEIAGDGLGVANAHGLPPALGRDTWISFAAHSASTAEKRAAVNQFGLSVTLYGLPA